MDCTGRRRRRHVFENREGWSRKPGRDMGMLDRAVHDLIVERYSTKKPRRELSEAERLEERRFWREKWESILPESVKKLLHKAIECCPSDMDSWLEFAKSQSYEDASRAISKACLKLPKEIALWVAAAKLGEANRDDTKAIRSMVYRGICVVQRRGGVSIDRQDWTKQAEAAERSGYASTSQAMFEFANMIGVAKVPIPEPKPQ